MSIAVLYNSIRHSEGADNSKIRVRRRCRRHPHRLAIRMDINDSNLSRRNKQSSTHKEKCMSTIYLHQTTNLTAEQYIAALTDFGPGRSKLFSNSTDDYLKVHH